jgi:hypothetical protein
MFWSWWNKNLKHEETINKKSTEVFPKFVEYYKKKINNGSLNFDPNEMRINYHRGNVIFSAFGIGTELWTKHYVKIVFEKVSDETTNIIWNIEMKFFGLQMGKNAIIEECKKLCQENV